MQVLAKQRHSLSKHYHVHPFQLERTMHEEMEDHDAKSPIDRTEREDPFVS
jgi:hypothetical protein